MKKTFTPVLFLAMICLVISSFAPVTLALAGESLDSPLSGYHATQTTVMDKYYNPLGTVEIVLLSAAKGSEVNAMIEDANSSNRNPLPDEEWVLMKFRMGFISGTKSSLAARDVLSSLSSFYNAAGTKLCPTTTHTASLGTNRNYQETQVTIAKGESAEVWYTILIKKSDGFPLYRIMKDRVGGVNRFLWFSSDPSYQEPNSSISSSAGASSSSRSSASTAGSQSLSSATGSRSSSSTTGGSKSPSSAAASQPSSSTTAAKFKLLIGKDNNHYVHCCNSFFPGTCTNKTHKDHKYFLSTPFYNKLVQGQTPAVRASVLAVVNSQWGGSCYGISTAMALVKSGGVRLDKFDADAKNFYTSDKPKDNSKIRDLINYYQLSQQIPSLRNTQYLWYASSAKKESSLKKELVLQGMISLAQKIKTGGKPFLVMFSWKSGSSALGHCVVGNDYSAASDGGHRIELVDPNNQSQYLFLNISKNLQSFSLSDKAGNIKYSDPAKILCLGFMSLNSLDQIKLESNTVVRLSSISETKTPAQLTVQMTDQFTITDSSGKTCIFTGDELNGDGALSTVRMIAHSSEDGNIPCDLVFDLADPDCTIVPSGDSIKASLQNEEEFSSVNAVNAKTVHFQSGNMTKITGDQMQYEAYLDWSSDSDNKLFKINDAGSGDVTLLEVDEGVILQSENLEDVSVQLLEVDSDISSEPQSSSEQEAVPEQKVIFSADQKEILLAPDPSTGCRSLRVLCSSKNDGVFDQVISAKIVEIPVSSPAEAGSSPTLSSAPSVIMTGWGIVGIIVLVLGVLAVISWVVVRGRKRSRG